MNNSALGSGGRGSFFGKYRGVVIENVDLERRGRIRAMVPDVYGELPSGWALPSLPAPNLASGIFTVPGIGASVWIEFEQGNAEFPIWSGGFWQTAAQVPTAAALGPPSQMVFQTALGNLMVLDDEQGGITLQTAVGHSIQINATGITLMTASGAMLLLGAAGVVELTTGKGGSVTLSANTVQINNGALTVI